ncbi:hypothetical protein C8J56DRAFT_1058357 [Mycena floridula]|nr:hypothetical protein C8J56DRAFT_1058357 [Mycena floridula]
MFHTQWNAHPISGEGHNQSPNDMCLLGKLAGSVYLDDNAPDEFQGVDESVLEHYYGVSGSRIRRPVGQTGAGHPEDEADMSAEELESDSDSEMGSSDSGDESVTRKMRMIFLSTYLLCLNLWLKNINRKFYINQSKFPSIAATTNDLIPDGYGLTPEERDEDGYPVHEILRSGQQGTKELRISLPFAVWKPWADMWGQALYIMNSLLFGEDSPDEEEPLFLPGSSDDDDDDRSE